MRALHLALLAVVLSSVPVLSCSCPVRALDNSATRAEWRSYVTLYSHPLEIRLSRPQAQSPPFLVIYATGDGGWHGLDEQIYDWIAGDGYAAAGFSSRDYLKNLGYVSETTTPRRLVQDFAFIISFAEDQLGLPPSTPVILAGLSRGAGLSTVAAGQGGLQPRLAGLMAIALTREEEYVRHYSRRERHAVEDAPRRELVEIKTYDYLTRISRVPVLVIQSSGDNYLTADAARGLFGPDTPLRRLRPVEATNHRFSGGCSALYQETISGLQWICHFSP